MSREYVDLLARLAGEVYKMRARQKLYFKNRSQVNLVASIESEKVVDALLAELKQPRLEVDA